MSMNKKLTPAMILANKKREEIATKTYTVERLLDRRKRKGRFEYLVKWKHWKSSHNSWEPEENILDRSLIDNYKHRETTTTTSGRRSSVISPKKIPPIRNRKEPLSNRRRSSVLSNIVNEPQSPQPTIEKEEEEEEEIEEQQKQQNSLTTETIIAPVHYWYPPSNDLRKDKIAITDVTSGNVTITFRELI